MADHDKHGAAVDAELSSLASQLEALIRRIEDLAIEAASIDSNEITDRTGLHEVERHLRSALRELNRARRA
ncbi:MAG: hypothetical protein QF844_03600 [Acidimicrobiales bacterium]|jgi:hypothetical protein|nr:hypothetical protein [Acidimicrobiales bacterium]